MKALFISFLLLTLIQIQSHAQTQESNNSCLAFAEAVFTGNQTEREENARISCLGNKSLGNTIQQCLLKAVVVLDSEKYAAIACSFGSDVNSIQSCIQLAQAVLVNSEEKGLNSAIACSGSTLESNMKIQQCISSKRADLNSETEAARACGQYKN